MTIEDPIVLLVDDSDKDGLLMRTVFERAGFVQPLRTVEDGEEAIGYLNGDGIWSDRLLFPIPTVMLLDLNMPRKNGFEVLAWVRQQPAFNRLPIFILSASSRVGDIQRAYDLGANSYLVKPGNLNDLMHLAKTLVAWLRLSEFAPLEDADWGSGFQFPPSHSTRSDGAATPAKTGHRSATGNGTSNGSTGETVCDDLSVLNARLTRRLEEQEAELHSLQARMQRVGHAVGHDLRGHLMNIGGYAETMRDCAGWQLEDKGRKYLQTIIASTEKLDAAIAGVIALTKVPARAAPALAVASAAPPVGTIPL